MQLRLAGGGIAILLFVTLVGPAVGLVPDQVPCPLPALRTPGCAEWVASEPRVGQAVFFSPDSTRLYVAYGHFVKAFNASSGVVLWSSQPQGAWGTDHLSALSKDGHSIVFASVSENGPTLITQISTVDGSILWQTSLSNFYPVALVLNVSNVTYVAGATRGDHVASILTLDDRGNTLWFHAYPDSKGETVFSDIAATDAGAPVLATGRVGDHALTVAVGAESGNVIWSKTYVPASEMRQSGMRVAISHDGMTAYVMTGTYTAKPVSEGTAPLIAYKLQTGTLAWSVEPPASLARFFGYQRELVISSDGSSLFVGGQACDDDEWQSQTCDYGIYSVTAASGRVAWTLRHDVRPLSRDAVVKMALSSSNNVLYAAGFDAVGGSPAQNAKTPEDVVAVDASSGAVSWASSAGSYTFGLAVAPDGNTLAATGWGEVDQLNVATDAGDGQTYSTTAFAVAAGTSALA
ncbi:MAG: PQQ-binding-like beta-propeller repeat protein [Halobacteriales archaeon]|nr:PQQ-binding-like beta-propeller repeat protein [Halobacteriales archaeon]